MGVVVTESARRPEHETAGTKTRNTKPDSTIHRPQIGAPVLVVQVTNWATSVNLLNEAAPGRCVRLIVGETMPPVFGAEHIKPDLRIQVEANREHVLTAWTKFLGGEA